ncbi:MAG: glycoside hydrolase family 78 protein [Bacteroidales bacterium]|nr:glycoside hydrolase family 78 protein [Bacteroidales bacterium]
MKKLLILFTGILLTHACSKEVNDPPTMLRTEYGSNIVDTSEPRFSWILADSSRGVRQSACQVLVASDKAFLTDKKADMWNTGKVESDQSVFVTYSGAPLQSGTRYYWTVRTCDQDGQVTGWSEPVFFETALDDDDWVADWIGTYASKAKTDGGRPRSILLRDEFGLEKNIRLARAYVTGLGSYQLFLNGKKVSDDLLTPGWTDYPTRIMYQVYDVTKYLVRGNNAAGMILGNVWYSSGLGWQGGQTYSTGPMMGLLQIEVEYTNGKKELIVSDASWEWAFSPVVKNSLYHGETYDARLEQEGWNEAGTNLEGWAPVDVFDDRKATLSAHTSPPIQVTREIAPVKINPLDSGVYVFDMGLNMTGGIRLQVEGKAGTEVVMKFAELLHEDGSVAQENLRSAEATDRYILKGGGPETWEPAFTYHGFRYVEISGLPDPPDPGTVTGLNFHNAADETGSFRCSNALLNTIQANIGNGLRSNMFSVPTDCPQRDERLGWMGDAQIFAATSCYNMDMSGFYAKWVRDIADSQSPEGWVTDVNPAIVVTDPAKPAWGDAFLVVPWEMYRFYNDTRILETWYEDYKAWVEYMRSNTEDDGLYIYDRDGWGGYADWIAVVESPKQPISAAYYYYSTSLLARFAEILGYTADHAEYTGLADTIREAFQDRYFDPEEAVYEGGTQTALLLPVNFSLTPAEQKAAVVANLEEDVVQRGYHPSTGFLGTKYLLPTLSDFGYHETAWKTAISEEYPSWGYMAVNGATSMWELWNSDTEPPDRMNSRNHFALGSIGEWFYSHLAGIRIDEEQPGFKHSIIAPMPASGLDWAEGKIETPYGTLKSAWKKADGLFTLEVRIPANTTATVHIPVLQGTRMELYENGAVLVKEGAEAAPGEGVTLESVSDESVTVEVSSGNYTFELLYQVVTTEE